MAAVMMKGCCASCGDLPQPSRNRRPAWQPKDATSSHIDVLSILPICGGKADVGERARPGGPLAREDLQADMRGRRRSQAGWLLSRIAQTPCRDDRLAQQACKLPAGRCLGRSAKSTGPSAA